MAVEFNKYANNYNLLIGKEKAKKADNVVKEQEVQKQEDFVAEFKGLENETDLLTKNTQNLYRIKIEQFNKNDRDIADETNKILAELGCKIKVDAKQVASVAKGINEVVIPALDYAQDNATAARIADPNGPFADLFAI